MKKEEINFKALKIETLSATLLGLITGGFFCARTYKKWCISHKSYKLGIYEQINFEEKNSLQAKFVEKIDLIIRLANINEKFILSCVGLLVGAFIWEEILHKRNFLMLPEEYFWGFIWITLSLLGVIWALIILQLQEIRRNEQTIEGRAIDEAYLAKNTSWLLKGNGGRVYALLIINIILALGLLPLIIFPPLAFSAINNYVNMEKDIYGIMEDNSEEES